MYYVLSHPLAEEIKKRIRQDSSIAGILPSHSNFLGNQGRGAAQLFPSGPIQSDFQNALLNEV